MKTINLNTMHNNKIFRYRSIAILAIVFSVFIACNSSDKKDDESHDTHMESDVHQDHESESALALNNGAKWKADASTNQNVEALKSILAANSPASLEEYHATGKELQTGINKMISECRMQGADHDALHLWLEPLMGMNKKLQAAGSAEEGAESLAMIQEQVNLYPQYFE